MTKGRNKQPKPSKVGWRGCRNRYYGELSDGNGFAPIAWLHRLDLPATLPNGRKSSTLSDEELAEIAGLLGTRIIDEAFWTTLGMVLEELFSQEE